jgi:photosystem II stability/assembly factor-like uncharacterized protein
VSACRRQPSVFYVGVNNGGVWKTDDYGRTWQPIFDSAPTGSVGDVAIAPSNPDVVYIGSGEGLHRPDLGVGDGIFKSIDGGRTWHVGLADIQQVGRIVVHAKDPDIVFVAGMGHPYGPNDERGVFRTVDGGRTWEKVLFVDRNTGAGQVEIVPTNRVGRVRGAVESSRGPAGERQFFQTEQWHVQIHHRRDHVEQTRGRPARWRAAARPHCLRDCRERSAAPLRTHSDARDPRGVPIR